MSQAVRSTVQRNSTGGAVEAIVSEVIEPGRVMARLASGEHEIVRARVAAAGYVAHEGDRVLVLRGQDAAEHFVVGVLVCAAPPALTVGGAQARAEDGAIVVRDAQGRAVLSYDPKTGGVTLSVEEGDLTLASRTGRVVVESAKELELRADLIDTVAREVRTRAEFVGFTAARWDLSVGKITERARNVFRDVSGLLQTRANRASIIAESTLSLFGRRTSVRSKDDTSIKGKRVLLG